MAKNSIYLGMTADVLHHGHINIISKARKLGDLTIGLLTDRAIANFKRLPFLTWEQRKSVLENIVGVSNIVPQDDWDYSINIRKYKPDIMIHGTDWLNGPLLPYRKRAIEALEEYGGELVEIDYTKDVSSSNILESLSGMGVTPESRCKSLKRLIENKDLVRIIECQNPISARMIELLTCEVKEEIRQFDGFWSSSLIDSTILAKPDTEAVDMTKRLTNIDAIFEVTSKPLIIDADTGGQPEHFAMNIKSMDRLGVSAAIIEDKKGLKKNSLLGNEVLQHQEEISSFCQKIQIGRKARISDDFMIFARIESLILEQGMDEALERAEAYIETGVDGIMIHSRQKTPDEVFTFSKNLRERGHTLPLVCVPTTYNTVKEAELIEHGFNVVIYANHLFRAAYPAILNAAKSILENQRTAEIENELMSMKEILELIPGTK